MLIVIAIIAVNYLVFPIIAIAYPEIMNNVLELPDQLWNLLTLGVGGYVVGRSGEKMVDKWTNPSKGKQMLGYCWSDKNNPCGKCFGCWNLDPASISATFKLKSGTMLTSICLFDY